MKKFALQIICLICASSAVLAQDIPATIKGFVPTVVFVVPVKQGDEPSINSGFTGSGIVIGSNGYILTADHVRGEGVNIKCQDDAAGADTVDGYFQIWLNQRIGEDERIGEAKYRFDARCVAHDSKSDVALLEFIRPAPGQSGVLDLPAAQIFEIPLMDNQGNVISQDLVALGYGQGNTSINPKALRTLSGSTSRPLVLVEGTLPPGYSGGAVFNLVGCVVALSTRQIPFSTTSLVQAMASVSTLLQFYRRRFPNIEATQRQLASQYSCNPLAVSGRFTARLGMLIAPGRNDTVNLGLNYVFGGPPAPAFRLRLGGNFGLGQGTFSSSGQLGLLHFWGGPEAAVNPYAGAAVDVLVGGSGTIIATALGVIALGGLEVPVGDYGVSLELGVGFLIQANPTVYFSVGAGFRFY